MEQYFDIRLTDDQLRAISSVGLAHMGDAVFEILVRGWLCAHGKATGKGLHQATIRLVCAESQSQKTQRILPLLTPEELADRIVPDLGFGEDMSQTFDYGPRHFTVYLSPSLELEIQDQNGKRLKSLPAPGNERRPGESPGGQRPV